MGIFSRNGDATKEAPVTPPPIFFNKSTDVLKKMPSSKRLDIMHSSSPDLGLGGSVRSSVPPKRATPRRRSFNGSLPPVPPKVSSPKMETNSASAIDYSLRRSNSNDGSRDESYIIEEIELDEASYEEVVIEDDAVSYVEEEILEEVIIQEKFPAREFKIRFDDFDELQTTLHINDYSPGEVENTWYGRDDYDKMVKKARDAVAKVDVKEEAKSAKAKKKGVEKEKKKGEKKKKDKGKKNIDEDAIPVETDAHADEDGEAEKSLTDSKKSKKSVDVRGLEGWSTSGSLEIRALKQKAVDAVWNEQNRQWTFGYFDVERLREAYRTVSAEAQAIAQARGANDRAEADKIHGSTRDKHLRFIRHAVLLTKATKKVKEVVAKKKTKKKKKEDGEEVVEPMKRNIVRQPSQGSRLMMDEGSFEFALDESARTCNSTKGDLQSRKPRRPSLLARTPSWESGLSSGKY